MQPILSTKITKEDIFNWNKQRQLLLNKCINKKLVNNNNNFKLTNNN